MDSEELETVQDYIEKVKLERGFVKEVEDDRASQRTTTSMTSSVANSFVVVGAAGSGAGSSGDNPNPRCHCGLPTVVLQTHKQGANFQRQFFRCPKYRNTTTRCSFFQWLEEQPFWRETTTSGYRPPSPAKPPPPAGPPPPSPAFDQEFQRPANVDVRHKNTYYADPNHCTHVGVNGCGTNAFQVQKRCPHCFKVVFQKDKRTGKVIYLDLRWQVPLHLRNEVLGSDVSTAPSTQLRDCSPEDRPPGSQRSSWTARAWRHHHLPRAGGPRKARKPWRATRRRRIPWMRTTGSSWTGRSSRTCSSARRVQPVHPASAAECQPRVQTTPSSQAPFYE